jgi:hypothetical protein
MKFKEYLKETETPTLKKLTDNFNKKFGWVAITAQADLFFYDSGRASGTPDKDDDDENSPIEKLFDENGEVTNDFRNPKSMTIFGREDFELNMAEDFPGMIGLKEHLSIRPDTKKGARKLIIKTMRGWPISHGDLMIDVGLGDITTFEGIEKQQISALHIDMHDENSLKCGVLRLMKCPRLSYVNIAAVNAGGNDDLHIRKLNEIINKNLINKDIADCMEDLMEAGLKEYAKL